MFFSLVRVITPVLCVLVQVNCQMFFDNVKVEVLAISEMELSKEFTSKEEIEIFFCDLFRKVQKVFDTIPGLNITIELSGVSVNWRANKQNYLEKNKWTYENETFIKPVALISLLEYANIKRSWDVYDAAILFTRIPCANPNGQNGEPQFVPGRNLSVRSYFFAPTGCEYKPSMAIMYPNPRGVAYELAYLLGAFEQGVILKKPSWFENCKENSIPRNGYVKSDPNGPFSKCAILGIKNYLRIPYADPNRKNGKPKFVPNGNLSVKNQPFTLSGCEYRPSVAIMYPDPKDVAYELAYLLGAIEEGVILNNPSRFENCKEGSIPRNDYVKSDPNGPLSKCALMGIKDQLRTLSATCFFENNHPTPLQCSRYQSR